MYKTIFNTLSRLALFIVGVSIKLLQSSSWCKLTFLANESVTGPIPSIYTLLAAGGLPNDVVRLGNKPPRPRCKLCFRPPGF